MTDPKMTETRFMASDDVARLCNIWDELYANILDEDTPFDPKDVRNDALMKTIDRLLSNHRKKVV